MPYKLEFEGRGFCVRHTGHVTFDEIAEANDIILDHDAWDTHDYQIWSYLEASALDGEKREARVISSVDEMSSKRHRVKPIKVAFVSTNAKTNELIEGYIDTVDDNLFPSRIFRTEDEARAWVGA